MKKYIIIVVLLIALVIFIKLPASNQSLYIGEYENISLQTSAEKVNQLMDENTMEFIPLTYSSHESRKCKIRKIDGMDKLEFVDGQDTYILYKVNKGNIYKSICLDMAEKNDIRVSDRLLRTIKINKMNLGSYIFEEQNKSKVNGIIFNYGETDYTNRFKMLLDYKQLDTASDVYKFAKAFALSRIINKDMSIGALLIYNTSEKTFEPYLRMEGANDDLYHEFTASYYSFTVENTVKFYEYETILSDDINKIMKRYELKKEFENEIVSALYFNNNSILYGLFINEVMPANKSSNKDPKGDTPDWIELYNGSGKNVNLSGYKLRNNESNTEWVFPDINLTANNYMIIWCSEKEQYELNNLHTNFKLKAGYGNIELLDDNSNVLDYCIYEDMPNDKTYGKVRSDIVKTYLAKPTYGNMNTTKPRS